MGIEMEMFAYFMNAESFIKFTKRPTNERAHTMTASSMCFRNTQQHEIRCGGQDSYAPGCDQNECGTHTHSPSKVWNTLYTHSPSRVRNTHTLNE